MHMQNQQIRGARKRRKNEEGAYEGGKVDWDRSVDFGFVYVCIYVCMWGERGVCVRVLCKHTYT